MRETILICDDEELVRWSLSEHFRRAGYRVIEAADGQSFLNRVEQDHPNVALLDLRLPDIDGLTALRTLRERGDDLPVIMLTAVGGIEPVIEATRLGAASYLTKPFELGDVELAIEEALAAHHARTHVAEPSERQGYDVIIGSAASMEAVFSTLRLLEQVDTPSVVITGESGTGKDLVAQAIHRRGTRSKEPFVEVDCTAIPENLMESTLFGHERGAFTDAKSQKRGLFEDAGRGIVFLDELGEMPLTMQAKLLRALENRTFKRVGGNHNIHFEAAVIAATNHDLLQQVEAGKFRKDLYYRLAVVEMHVPALASRREDIPLLVDHFVRTRNHGNQTQIQGFTQEAMALLQNYSWPGNVRELRNVVERVTLFANGPIITAAELPSSVRFAVSEAAMEGCPFELPKEGVDLEQVERGLVTQALERTGGNQTQAAKLLGLSRYALRSRLKKYDLKL